MPLYPGNYNCAGTSSVMSGEKTFTIFNDANHYHGQSYLRLSLAARVYFDTSAAGYDYDTTFAQVYRAWMSIIPLPRNPGIFGGGAQQWPEGYQWPAGGTFSWYGGGDAPPVLGPDGNEI